MCVGRVPREGGVDVWAGCPARRQQRLRFVTACWLVAPAWAGAGVQGDPPLLKTGRHCHHVVQQQVRCAVACGARIGGTLAAPPLAPPWSPAAWLVMPPPPPPPPWRASCRYRQHGKHPCPAAVLTCCRRRRLCRCFPTKAIALWTATGDADHVWIVGSYFHYRCGALAAGAHGRPLAHPGGASP